ncbi:MAG: hypothetical protein AAFV80_12700 [Bacteroidota bacterium]
MKTLNTLLFLLILLSSCQPNPTAKQAATFVDAQTVYLKDDMASLKLPKHFDVMELDGIDHSDSTNQTFMNAMAYLSEIMQFEDNEIDYFQDTTDRIHFFMVTDFELSPLTEEIGGVLNSSLTTQCEYLSTTEGLHCEKLEGKLSRNNKLKYFKFKYRYGVKEELVLYAVTYLFQLEYTNLCIYEIANHEEDLESYFWSLKG